MMGKDALFGGKRPAIEALEQRLLLNGDVAGPCIVDYWPDEAVAATDHIDVTFDEPIDPATFTPDDVGIFPEAPSQIGGLSLGSIRAVAVDGSLLYAVGGNGLRIYDISDPQSPQPVGSLAPGYTLWDVEVAGSRAFLMHPDDGLIVADVSDPAAPTLLASLDPGGYFYDLELAGERLYLAASYGGLHVVDISVPEAPELLGTLASSGQVEAVEVVGSRAYVGCSDGSFQIVDVSTPSAPALVGEIDTPGRVTDIRVVGDLAYVVGGELAILDVSSPEAPELLGSHETSGAALDVLEGMAYVAGGTAGLQVLDVSDPAAPAWLSESRPGWQVDNVQVFGDRLYACGWNDCWIYQVRCHATGVTQAAPGQWRVGVPAGLPDGVYDVRVGPEITDLAGNAMDQDGDGVGGDECRFSVVVDSVPPDAPAVRVDEDTGRSDGDEVTSDTEIVASWSPPEDLAGIASYEYRWGGGEWTPTEETEVPPQHLDEGKHVFEIRSVDVFGRVGQSRSATVTVDTTPPAAPAHLYWRDGALRWPAAEDNHDVWKYRTRVDGGEWIETTGRYAGFSIDEGTHVFEVLAVDVAGNEGPAVAQQLDVDLTPPRVVSTSVVPGAVFAEGDVTVELGFDEPLAAGVLDASDVELVGDLSGAHHPAAFSYDAQTSRLSVFYTGLAEDRYTFSLLSGDGEAEDVLGNDLDGEPAVPGAVPSGDGAAGGSFHVSFYADTVQTSWPLPLAPHPLPGAAIRTGQVSGWICQPGDVDAYTVELLAGQTLALVGEADADLRLFLEVRDGQEALVAEAEASAPGESAYVLAVPVSTAGVYGIAVSGASDTTGAFSLELVLNADVAAEDHGGPDSAEPDTAQDIDSSFIHLGASVRRGAVLGRLEAGRRDQDCYAFTLDAGQAVTLTADSTGDAQMMLSLRDWDGVVPEEYLLQAVTVTDDDDVSRLVARKVELPAIGSRIRDVTPEGDVFAYVIAQIGRRGVLLDRRLGLPGVRDVYATPPLAGELYAMAHESPGGLASIRRFVAPAAGTYYVVVSSPADEQADYTLAITSGGELEAEANDSPVQGQDVPACGVVLGSLPTADLGRLFAYDGRSGDICELDPDTGAPLNAFPPPVAPCAGLGLATTGTSLLVGGARDGNIFELDPDTGAVLRTIPKPAAGVQAAGYADGEILLFLAGDEAADAMLSELAVAVHNSARWLWAMPLGLESPWRWKLSQEQFDEFLATPYHGQNYDYTGYQPGIDPDTYWLAFEDQGWKGGGDRDYYDIMLKVEDLSGGSLRITPRCGQAGYDFDLVRLGPEREVILPDLKGNQGVPVVTEAAAFFAPDGWLATMADLYILRCPSTTAAQGYASYLTDILDPSVPVEDPRIWAICPLTGANDAPKGELWSPELIPDPADNQAFIGVDDDAALLITFGLNATMEVLEPPQKNAPDRHFLMRGAGTPRSPCPDGQSPADEDDEELLHLWSGDFPQIDPRSPLALEVGSPSLLALDYATGMPNQRQWGTGRAWGLVGSWLGLWGIRGNVLHQVDPETGETAVLTELPEVVAGGGLGIIRHELFVADAGRIEVYDVDTWRHLRTLRPEGVTSILAVGADQAEAGDYFRIEVNAGDELTIHTETPPAVSPAIGGPLDAVLKLYDPAGAMVASDDNGAGDGLNARIEHTAATNGTYVVRVFSAPGSSGEYVLRVGGATGGAEGFRVESAGPLVVAPGGRVTFDFSHGVLLPSLAAEDLTIGDQAADGYETIDGDTIAFRLSWAAEDGTFDVAIEPGAIQDVSGRPVAAFTGELEIDGTPPVVACAGFDPEARAFSVRFSEAVLGVSKATFALSDLTTGEAVDSAHLAVAYDPATATATISAPGLPGGQLPYGHEFSLVVSASDVTDAAGHALDGDGDGQAGGDFPANLVAAVLGDADCDGTVGRADFLQVRANFGRTDAEWPHGDFTGDGGVDYLDYLTVKRNAGQSCAPGAVAPLGAEPAGPEEPAEAASPAQPNPPAGLPTSAPADGSAAREARTRRARRSTAAPRARAARAPIALPHLTSRARRRAGSEIPAYRPRGHVEVPHPRRAHALRTLRGDRLDALALPAPLPTVRL